MIINQGSGKENLDEILTAQDNLMSQVLGALEGKGFPDTESDPFPLTTIKVTNSRDTISVYDRASKSWVAVNGTVSVSVTDHLLIYNRVELMQGTDRGEITFKDKSGIRFGWSFGGLCIGDSIPKGSMWCVELKETIGLHHITEIDSVSIYAQAD